MLLQGSMGALLTLSIYQERIGEDLLKGRRIAGTGTIEAGGRIGQVGSISQKVAAAHAGQASVFFDPNLGDFDTGSESNYTEAVRTNAYSQSEMQIIPVTHV